MRNAKRPPMASGDGDADIETVIAEFLADDLEQLCAGCGRARCGELAEDHERLRWREHETIKIAAH